MHIQHAVEHLFLRDIECRAAACKVEISIETGPRFSVDDLD